MSFLWIGSSTLLLIVAVLLAIINVAQALMMFYIAKQQGKLSFSIDQHVSKGLQWRRVVEEVRKAAFSAGMSVADRKRE